LIAVSKDAIPPQLAPYTALAALIVMAIALLFAVRIGLATTPKPTLKFADVLTLVFGVSRYELTGPMKYEALDDFALALTQSATIEEISIWGSRFPAPAFQQIKSALVKISPAYWEDHRIDTLAYAEKSVSVTQRLLTGLSRTPQGDAYFDLHFDKEEIRRFKTKWIREGLHSSGRKQQANPHVPKTASVLNRLWRDPVWSKVIATGITAGIGRW
jgi:hypothetical protein